jgi:glycosyltransferase involved in cell wall biosynthesis
MRVLHLSSLYPPTAYGGAEKVVSSLAEGLAARGVETAVAHLVPRKTGAVLRNGVLIHPFAYRNPLWIETGANRPNLVRNFNKVVTLLNFLVDGEAEEIINDFDPDIVHTHSMVELTPRIWKSARTNGARIVHTLHDYDLLCIRAALYKDGRQCEPRHVSCRLFSSVKRLYHRHIDHVVGVSNSILQTHQAYGFFDHLSNDHRHVIWNPANIEISQRPSRDPKEPFTFGFLGRLVPEKGIDLLMRACRQLTKAGWCLKVAGNAPKGSSDVQKQAVGLPIEFLGFVEPRKLLQAIDVLVVPSTWLEPFGLVVLEAYAAGIPVLGADAGGIAEIIGSVDSTWLVRPDDPEALARAMLGLIQQGRAAATQLPDVSSLLRKTRPDYVVEAYLQLYRTALRRGDTEDTKQTQGESCITERT